MNVVYGADDAVFLTYTMANSGTVTLYGWRIDDLCAPAVAAVSGRPRYTG